MGATQLVIQSHAQIAQSFKEASFSGIWGGALVSIELKHPLAVFSYYLYFDRANSIVVYTLLATLQTGNIIIKKEHEFSENFSCTPANKNKTGNFILSYFEYSFKYAKHCYS